MLLSIIIPHYNLPAELLKRCIESILSIGLDPNIYEIIVIDDGSDKAPLWLKETFGQENIKLIVNTHGGPGAARNAGIEAANGLYIQFVDSDDTLQQNNAMQQCIEILKKENPDILRFNFKLSTAPRTRSVIKNTRVKFSNTISGALYMKENNLSGCLWCYIVKKELLCKKEIRFRAGIFHEDEEFNTLTHYHAKTLIASNAQIYNYCIRNGSITKNSEKSAVEKRLNDHLSVIEHLCSFKASVNHSSNNIQKKGLERKLATLTVDHIINRLYAGESAQNISTLLKERFSPLMLYPIRNGDYSIKFNLFRLLANHNAGISFLRLIVPTYHKEQK